MVIDTIGPAINEVYFEKQDWASSEFGHTEGELLPSNITDPRGPVF